MIQNKFFESSILPVFRALLILDINNLSMIIIILVTKTVLLLLFLWTTFFCLVYILQKSVIQKNSLAIHFI